MSALFRELSNDELDYVSGCSGAILVIGRPFYGSGSSFGGFRGGSRGGNGYEDAFGYDSYQDFGAPSVETSANPDRDGDGVSDDQDADPNDPNVTKDIIVEGKRIDVADRAEIVAERLYYILNNRFTNAEPNGDGTFTHVETSAPTQDQIDFKNNYDKISRDLALFEQNHRGAISRFATALTDAHIDVVKNNLNMAQIQNEYSRLIDSSGAGRTMADFINWLETTKLSVAPTSFNNIDSNRYGQFIHDEVQAADLSGGFNRSYLEYVQYSVQDLDLPNIVYNSYVGYNQWNFH